MAWLSEALARSDASSLAISAACTLREWQQRLCLTPAGVDPLLGKCSLLTGIAAVRTTLAGHFKKEVDYEQSHLPRGQPRFLIPQLGVGVALP